MKVKFSTKDVAEKRAYKLAMVTRGRNRVHKSKKRKALEKKWKIKGY